jgi:hypothetical protein
VAASNYPRRRFWRPAITPFNASATAAWHALALVPSMALNLARGEQALLTP